MPGGIEFSWRTWPNGFPTAFTTDHTMTILSVSPCGVRSTSAVIVYQLESDPETRAILRDGRAWIRHENRKTRTNQEMAEDAGF